MTRALTLCRDGRGESGWMSPSQDLLVPGKCGADVQRLPELDQGAQIDGDSLDGKYREGPETDWQQSNEVKTKIGYDLGLSGFEAELQL